MEEFAQKASDMMGIDFEELMPMTPKTDLGAK